MELILDHVEKTIRNAKIIDDISAHWHGGRVYGLRGYNGAGKTMLMRLISGLIHPTNGTITVDGVTLGKEMEFPPSVGMLIESPGFLDQFTGFENLRLLAQLKGVASEEAIRSVLETVGLEPGDKRRFRKYSLGMKQRLGIACAVMERPDLVILDEPTNALDSDGVQMVLELVRQERERGALVVLSCHDEGLLRQMSDVIYTMEHGRFVQTEEVSP